MAEDKIEADKIRRRLAAKRYRERHPDRVRESRRKYDDAHPEANTETCRRWRQKNPGKAEIIIKRWWLAHPEKRREYQRQYLVRLKARGGPPTLAAIGEALETALGKNALFAAAKAAVPGHVPRDIRMDAIQSIILAVLEGEIAEADIPTVAKQFVAAQYRQRDQHSIVSLDAPVRGTDHLRFVDTIASDAVHF